MPSKSKSTETVEGRCMKCKKQQKMVSPKLVKKGKGCFMMGTCSVCGTKMSRITSCK